MHLANASFWLSISFMHNRTKHWSNCVCIRPVWYYMGKKCWTTHFHFTEQENRSSVMLAGDDISASPWEPSHLYWTTNVTTRALIKKSISWLITLERAGSWKNSRNIHLMFMDTVVFAYARVEEGELILWADCQNWVVKRRRILQACAKHLQ